MAVCDCEVGLSNTGIPGCVPIAGVTKKIIMLNYYDNDGAVNKVSCGDAFDEAYFTALTNQADTSKRWYPLPEIKNVDSVKGDSIFESFNDGSNVFVQEGARTFTGMLPNQSPEFLGQLKAARCVAIGVFIIDEDGNLIGNGSVDGELRPIRVDNNSWNPILMKGTDTTIQKITLSYEYSRLERDEDIRMLTSDEFTYSLLDLRGIKDVNFVGMAVTLPSQVDFTANTIYGSQCSKVTVQGLDLSDFSATVDAVSETIVSVTEATPGVYTLGLTSVLTGGEVVVVDITKDNFEVISGNTVTA